MTERIGAAFRNSSGRVIAATRLLLALVFLSVVWIDPAQPTRAFATGYVLLSAYLLLSIALMAVAWKSWWWDHRLASSSLSIDIAVFVAAVFFTEGADVDFTSPFLSFFAFLMLSATIRWDWRFTVITSAIVTGLYLLVGLVNAGIDPDFDTLRFGRRVLYMIVLSMVIAWFGLQRRAMTIERFIEFVDTARDETVLMNHALRHAMTQTGAGKGVIAWDSYEEPDVRLIALGMDLPADRIGPGGTSPPSFAAHVNLFDRPRARRLLARRHKRAAAVLNAPDDELAVLCNIPSGLALPLAGLTGRGEIILCDIPGLGTDHLELGRLLSEDISDAFDRRAAFIMSNESTLARMRVALARDLHDTLLQSLAGTSLRLEGLRNWIRSGGDPDSEIETIKNSLREEQLNVRDLLARLKSDQHDSTLVELDRSTRTLLDALAVRWGVAIQLSVTSVLPNVTERLAREVGQLLRESVANAVKHGRASRIDVALSAEHGILSIAVEDNGQGFPTELAEQRPRSIDQRLTDVDGSLSVQSSAAGSRLTMTMPLGELA